MLFVRPSYFVMVDALSAMPHTFTNGCLTSEKIWLSRNWIKGYAGSDRDLGVGVIAPQPFESVR